MFTFSKIEGTTYAFESCPYCGGKPEWVSVPGEDFIMRCTQCHASTRKARMEPEAAVKDWNRGEINNDHFSITSDKKIDEYLHNIKMVLFSGYLFDEFPSVDGGFLCSDAVIIADGIILSVEPYEEHLQYDELSEYSPDLFCKPITETTEEIRFISSFWSGKNLTAIVFQCGDVTVTVSADKEKQCMMVVHN